MVINHNIPSLNVLNQYRKTDFTMQKSIEKIASGFRINSAGDNPSGLAVSEKMRAQISGLHRAMENTQDGIHFIQTAESWIGQSTSILNRLRELAVQASNGIYTYEDRMQIQNEVNSLVDEVDRISQVAEYNTLKLLRGGFRRDPADLNYSRAMDANRPYNANSADAGVRPLSPDPVADPSGNEIIQQSGTATPAAADSAAGVQSSSNTSKGGGVYLHVGANMDQRIKLYIENLSSFALGLASEKNADGTVKSSLNYTNSEDANQAIGRIDTAMYLVSRERSNLGATQNRLEFVVDELASAYQNAQTAESQIRDTNIAEEMTNFTSKQIMLQAASSMLVHSNMRSQVVLKLLGA